MPSQSGGLFRRNSSTDTKCQSLVFLLYRSLFIFMEFVRNWECLVVSIINSINSFNVNKFTFQGCYTLASLYAYIVSSGKLLLVGPLLSETRFARSSNKSIAKHLKFSPRCHSYSREYHFIGQSVDNSGLN